MNINGKIEVNNKIKKCLSLLEDGNFDEIDKIIDTINIKNNSGFDFIINYINECKRYYLMKNSKNGSLVLDYINSGKEALDNNEYQKALYIFNKAFKNTGDPIFNYYLGITYFKLKNYTMANDKLSNYALKSFYKLEESYEYLSIITEEIAYKRYEDGKDNIKKYREKSNLYKQKYKLVKKIKSGIIFNIEKKPVDLNLNDKEISKLISSGKINDTVEIFYESTYERKIVILALLYKNGNGATADKLLKQYRDELKENCPEFLSQLNKNKKLYLNQARFKK